MKSDGVPMRYRRFLRFAVMASMLVFSVVFLGACGFSREEKQRMKEITWKAEENAVNYIEDKYGITVEATGASACTMRYEVLSHPTIVGCAVVSMKYEGKTFQVHISGTTDTLQGTDDFQHDVILEEAKEYFTSLLGYEIHDFYMEYANGEEKNLISELYQSGEIENFFQRHVTSIRIDDCKNQDFTDFQETNPEAAAFLEQCAVDCRMKTILISYRSEEDYQSGYKHTYGRGGVMDFEIYKDGLYIRSYAVFEEEDIEYNRFELQEYDGMIVSCIDKTEGSDLTVSSGQTEWKDLGETKKAPSSDVYSIDREGRGAVTVYIPYEQFSKDWKGRQIYIQHYSDDKWWQYRERPGYTKDKKYLFFTYFNFDGEGGFDFAIF